MKYYLYMFSGIAWPVAIVWISFQFKTELRALLGRIAQITPKDADPHFEIGISKAEAEQVVMQKTWQTPPPTAEISCKQDQLLRIAGISPRAAVLEAWVMVEETVENFGFAEGAAIRRANPQLFLAELVDAGRLPKGAEQLLRHLQGLQERAGNTPDSNISPNIAYRYTQLAVGMAALIQSAE